ncbi:MAG: sigma-70 family RNA polymerase sigma factor [Oscillospiraceae bacterium]|nr:sigma-70 family RNA polymerase sigma factor [Oscillospiraceae bacterium]
MNNEQSDFISALHAKYASSLVQLTYRRIGDTELAKELVQETFLIACCKPTAICSHDNPAGWLFNTLKKLTMREMKRAYHSEVPINYDFADEHEESLLSMDVYIPQGLTDKERELILWRVNEEISFEEIANRRGVSVVACRKQVSRAFQKCRDLLSKEKVDSK